MQRQNDKGNCLIDLAKIPIFAHLSPESLHFLAGRLVRRHLSPGEMIFSEAEACNGLYVVEAGLVKLYKLSKDGREQVLATHGPGQTLSELPMIDGDSHPFSAAALVKSTVLFISRETLEALCQREPGCTRQVLGIIAARLRSALGMVGELSFSPVSARLAAYLLRTASAKPPHNGFIVQLPTNQEIAARVGTVRELVSRHLGQLQTKGIIRITGRTMQVLDANALAGEATAPSSRRTQYDGWSLSTISTRTRRTIYHRSVGKSVALAGSQSAEFPTPRPSRQIALRPSSGLDVVDNRLK